MWEDEMSRDVLEAEYSGSGDVVRSGMNRSNKLSCVALKVWRRVLWTKVE
ncbi:hypothetical protein A2U01_0058480, partial [Trifolium medium]|nr:hypothetical protein [Trifolium medium]